MKKLFFVFLTLCLSFVGLNAQDIFRTSMVVDTSIRAFQPEVTLSVPVEYDNNNYIFIWSTGETTPSITFSMPYEKTEYSVRIIGSHGNEFALSISSECFLNLSVIPNEICAGGTAEMFVTNNLGSALPTGGDYNFYWSDNGPNTAARQFSPSITTEYSVTVTHVSGCATSMSRTVVVKPSMSVAIQGPDKLCVGESGMYFVTDQSGNPLSGVQYLWSTGGNQMSTTVTAGNNSFSLSVTVTQNGTCTSTAYQNVIVSPKPPISIDYVEAPGETAVLVNSVSGAKFLWSDNTTNQFKKFFEPSWTVVTVTDQNGCTNSANVDVNSIFACPPPVIIFETDTLYINCGSGCTLTDANIILQGTACAPTLEANSNGVGALLYNWSNGMVTKKITVTQSGDYRVTVTDMAGCTAISESVWVTKKDPPYVAFDADMGKLVGVFTNHSTGSSILGYLWNFGDGETSTESSPTHEYDNSGTYNVVLTVLSECGNFTASATVIANCMTLNAYAQDYTVCLNQAVKLSASVVEQQFIVWDWQPDANIPGDNTQNEATAFINQNTLFKVTARDIFNGCVATKEFWVYLDCTTASGEPDPNVYVAVYPNPSSDIFRITLNPGQYDVNLTDMEGRSIEGFSVTGDFEIAAYKLPSGVYNLQITGDKFHTTERLVVQR